MNEKFKKFIFNVENAEELFAQKSSLKLECENKIFLPPVEDVFINSAFNSANNSLSLLGIIKGNNIKTELITDGDYLLITDENNNPEFTVRNIENFGIYIFAGRPDLAHYEYNSPGISFDSLENFKNKLEKFAKLTELSVNETYRVNNIELNDNILYKFVPNKIKVENKTDVEQKREIPEALRRFYARIK